MGTSRLLCRHPGLVLNGGGNTAVELRRPNPVREFQDLLLVEASGHGLVSVYPAGFAAVRMVALLKLVQLDEPGDSEMALWGRIATIEPTAPAPSFEGSRHEMSPHESMDRTHADDVVTLTNKHAGEARGSADIASRPTGRNTCSKPSSV